MNKLDMLNDDWTALKSNLDAQVAFKKYDLARKTLVALAEIDAQRDAIKRDLKVIDGHLMTIKNDAQGVLVVKALKEQYKPYGIRIRVRGRDKNRRAKMAAAGLEMNHCGDVSLKVAEFIAIYANVPYSWKRS